MTKNIIVGTNREFEIEYSPEVAMKVLDKIIEWMTHKDHYASYSGEAIMQNDNTIIDAPELISDIVDDILKPELKKEL